MGLRDFDRDLNTRGEKGAEVIGKYLAERETHWDLVLASPAKRVTHTLDAMKAAIGATADKLLGELVFDERLYLASSDTLFEVVAELGGAARSVLVIGHSPSLQDAVLELVPPSRENALFEELARKFPTASLATVECEIDDWRTIGSAKGTLTHFIRPRDLDPSLGPER